MKPGLQILLLLASASALLLQSRICAQAGIPLWTNRYSHPVGSWDVSRCVVADNSGNVIVAGATDDGFTNGADMLIIKYSAIGAPVWTNRYSGPVNYDDSTSGLAVDSSGNVFVTGNSGGICATLGYSSAGVPLWTNFHSGPQYSYQLANYVAVSITGNVYVSGVFVDPVTGDDGFITVAYANSGLPLWTNLYTGLGGGDDQPDDIAVDGSGKVVVAGRSYDTNSSSYDLVVIAYAENGNGLWTNRFSEPGDRSESGTQILINNGNFYVGGYTRSPNTRSDFLTVAYSNSGQFLWANSYDGFGTNDDYITCMAGDSSGNVYVAGVSVGYGNNIEDFATVAYSAGGAPLWSNRYGSVSPINSPVDIPYVVSVDGNGDIVVRGNAGGYYAAVAYSPSGTSLRTNQHPGLGGADFFVSSNGTVHLTGSGYTAGSNPYDLVTIAFSSQDVPVWTNRYNAPGNANDLAQAVAVGANGNVYVTGSSSLSLSSPGYDSGSYGMATVAYSANGTALWTNRHESAEARATVVGSNGNVFVSGNSVGGFVTIAYSNSGVRLWTSTYSGSGSKVQAMAVDGNGTKVFVTGYANGNNGDSDYVTLAYSATNVDYWGPALLWTNHYKGPANSSDQANAVAVGANGNVYVAGGSGLDWATVCYSSVGAPLWTNRYRYPSGPGGAATAVVANGGNVYVTGQSYGTSSGLDYATIAYSSSGVALWTNRYAGSLGSQDRANAMAVDSTGNVIVTGMSQTDFLTLAYSSNGVPLWTNRCSGAPNRTDEAQAIAVDASGIVLVTGYSVMESNPGTTNYVTVAYSRMGIPLWTNSYDGPTKGRDAPSSKQSLAIGPDGSVYVTGASSNGRFADYATIKYAATGLIQLEKLADKAVLRWGYPSFSLESAPFITGAFTNVPGAASPHTNALIGSQQFFRLKVN